MRPPPPLSAPRPAALVAGLVVLAVSPLPAQPPRPTGSVDAGVATVRQPDQPTVTAPTVAGELHVDGPRLALRATAGATLAAADRWSAQAELGSSWIAASGGRGLLGDGFWELGATVSALRFNGVPAASSGVALVRRHRPLALGATGGAWAGAGAGMLARPGDATPIGVLEAGLWRRVSRLSTSLTLTAQRARLDTALVDSAGARLTVPEESPRSTPPFVALDFTGLATWRLPRVELSATAGARRAPRQSAGVVGTGLLTAAWWVAPGAGLTATLGALAADPLRGLPERRVVVAGVRLRPGRDARTPADRLATDTPTPAADVVVRAGRRVLRVRAPGATRVDVRGECTRWQPAALSRVGDAWELDVSLDPGTQHLVLRLDGGPWRPPANVPTVEDEFGERVGLVVVP